MATSESDHNRVPQIPEARFGMVDTSGRPIIERMMKDKQRAQEIYDVKIKPLVEPQHKGKLMVLDITTEDYIVGRDVDSMKKDDRCAAAAPTPSYTPSGSATACFSAWRAPKLYGPTTANHDIRPHQPGPGVGGPRAGTGRQ